jgi:hypothetical protein
MIEELRSRQEANQWLASGYCLSRWGVNKPEEVAQTATWVVAALAESQAVPPVGVVLDLGHVLFGRMLEFAVPPVPPHSRLWKALRAFEDQLLGRLALEPRMDALRDALVRLPELQRPVAIGFFVGSLLRRMRYQFGTAIQSGLVRELTKRPTEDFLEQGYQGLRQNQELQERLAVAYEELVKAAQRMRTLIHDSEVFALENMTLLTSLAQRTSVEQIVDIASQFDVVWPKRLRKIRQTTGDVSTRLEDESSYPTGGFSAISTSGAIENLVTSELIYMDNDKSKTDLFDMRYVEGELLYYTRDESSFSRRRRLIVWILDSSLERARFKDEGCNWQRMTILMGFLLASVRRLETWLGEEELRFQLVFTPDISHSTPLSAEAELCDLLLREWRDKNMAEVVRKPLAGLVPELNAHARRALVQVVHCSLQPEEAAWKAAKPERAVQYSQLVLQPRSWDTWCEDSIGLLQQIL